MGHMMGVETQKGIKKLYGHGEPSKIKRQHLAINAQVVDQAIPRHDTCHDARERACTYICICTQG